MGAIALLYKGTTMISIANELGITRINTYIKEL